MWAEKKNKEFGVKITGTGGVRWWLTWKLAAAFVEKIGLQNFLKSIVHPCIKMSYCEKTMAKLVKLCDDPSEMCKVIIELATIVDGGRQFMYGTYRSEGDGFLISTVYSVYPALDELVADKDSHRRLPNIVCAAVECEDIMTVAEAPLRSALQDARRDLHKYKKRLKALEAELQEQREELLAAAPVDAAPPPSKKRSRKGKGAKYEQRKLKLKAKRKQPELDAAGMEKVKPIMDNIKQIKADIAMAAAGVDEAVAKRDAWRADNPLRLIDDFLGHARRILDVAGGYYTRVFNTPVSAGSGITGDLYKAKRASKAATLFDPNNAYTVQQMVSLIDDLKFFDFPEFTTSFLEQMKSEVGTVMRLFDQYYDWDAEPFAKAYNDRLAEEAKKKAKKMAALEVAVPDHAVVADDGMAATAKKKAKKAAALEAEAGRVHAKHAKRRAADLRFRRAMAAAGFKIVEIRGDGNCLFRAASFLMFGNEENDEVLGLKA